MFRQRPMLRRLLMAAITEKAFQAKVIQLAYLKGWHVAHFTPAKVRDNTWVTPMTGHVGFPDLILARDGVVLAYELKSETGVATPNQLGWLQELGAIARLYRPADFPAIVKELAA